MAINLQISACKFIQAENTELVGSQGGGAYVLGLSGEPSWVTTSDTDATIYYHPPAAGEFTFNVQRYVGLLLIDSGTITITVRDCIAEYTPACCDNVYNIAWLTNEGGWRNYLFIGKATKGIDQGKGSDFKDADRVLKWSEVTDVYSTIAVGTGHIPRDHVAYTATLRYGIQAYLYDPSTGTWSIPIIVTRDNFAMFKRGDKFFEYLLEFKYATEIIVQTQ